MAAKSLVEGAEPIDRRMLDEKWRFYCAAVQNDVYKKRYKVDADGGFYLITGEDFLIVADDEPELGPVVSIEREDNGAAITLTFTKASGQKTCKITTASSEQVKKLTTKRTVDGHAHVQGFTELYQESINRIENPFAFLM